eukprot:TRINITY_DN1391_c0_g1_i1.p1 TRINITY_DN1391_c0_g1~~TRINITY_DN1391_c0_g1_i1.p1  ORF type:complete len:253 (-),score=67.32 TRINITY_DN1391_c0_g1_i1:96-854(-)
MAVILPGKMLSGVGDQQQIIFQQQNTILELQKQLNESLRRQKELEASNNSLMELTNALAEKLHQEQDNYHMLNNKLIAKGELIMSLREELDQEKKKVEEMTAVNSRLEEEKADLFSEYEQLSESLFQEANLLVSKEAREKCELKEKKEKLEAELSAVKKDFRNQIYLLAKSYNEACRDKVAEWNNIRARRLSQEMREKQSLLTATLPCAQPEEQVSTSQPIVPRAFKLELEVLKQSPPGCLTTREICRAVEL